MKKLLIAAMAVLTMVGTTQAAEKLRIATGGENPPFNFVGPDGKPAGFNVDFSMALCAEMNRECVIIKQEANKMIPGLLAEEYDLVIASMLIDEEMGETVDFSKKYYTRADQFITKKGLDIAPNPRALGSLSGKVIGAQTGTSGEAFVNENLKGHVELKFYKSNVEALNDLAAGRVDVVLADQIESNPWLQSKAGKGFELVGERMPSKGFVGVALRKESGEFIVRLNEAISALRFRGTYTEINEKYFPFDIY